jgi:hypothetical protein
MSWVLVPVMGMVMGWLIWNLAGEGFLNLGIYVTGGVAGTLCGLLFMGYLGKPFDGTLGAVTVAPVCALLLVSLVAYFDRKKLR